MCFTIMDVSNGLSPSLSTWYNPNQIAYYLWQYGSFFIANNIFFSANDLHCNVLSIGCNVLLYAGVLSIGVGDATASVIGVKFGKTKWKGTYIDNWSRRYGVLELWRNHLSFTIGLSKTVEGTLASCLSQFFLLVLLKPYGIYSFIFLLLLIVL